jgi:hypothetical protein
MSNQPIVKNKLGAPSRYTEAIGAEVCERLAEGMLITAIAVELGFAPSTLLEWRERYPDYAAAYARAEQIGFDRLAEKLLSIPKQDGDVQRQRLESDNIKWFLGKRNPRIYGDKLELNVNQTIDIGSALSEARARALRPVSDQQSAEDVEFVDIPSDSDARAHDMQSQAGNPGAESDPADKA